MRTNDETATTSEQIPRYAGGITIAAIVLLAAIRVGLVKGVK